MQRGDIYLPHKLVLGHHLTPGKEESGRNVSDKRRREAELGSQTGLSPKQKKNRKEQAEAMETEGSTAAESDKTANAANRDAESNGWTTVSKHKDDRRKHKDKRPIRTKSKNEAILIGSTGDTSYADILKQVKIDPKLKNIG